MKKRLAYYLACSNGIIFAAANVALSLNKYLADDDYEIIISTRFLSKSNKEALSKIPHVKLVDLKFPQGLETFLLSSEGLPSCRWKDRNSLNTIAHFEVFRLLDEYRTVVWIDSDIAIQGDVSGLANYGPLGLPTDQHNGHQFLVRDQFTTQLSGYNMDLPAYQNSCIVVTDDLPYKEMYHYCYETLKRKAKFLLNADQSVMQLLIQDFNVKVNEIPYHEYVCHAFNDYAALAKAVHFGAREKVWNNQQIFQSFPEWFRTHMRWLELGGDDFDRSNISSKCVYTALQEMHKADDSDKIVTYGESNFLYGPYNARKCFRNMVYILAKRVGNISFINSLLSIRIEGKHGSTLIKDVILKIMRKARIV